jgi:hypothetical protein
MRSRMMKARKPGTGRVGTLPRCTQDHVPRAEYRRMEAEYGRKLKAEGKVSAHRLSQQQGLLWKQRLMRQGVCR